MKLNSNIYMFLQQLQSFPANSHIRFPTRASGLPAADGSVDVHEAWAEVVWSTELCDFCDSSYSLAAGES